MIYTTGQAITYTAVGSTAGTLDTFTYAWAFDDLGSGSGNTLTHSWSTAGNHAATVVATDVQFGSTATASKTINIQTLNIVQSPATSPPTIDTPLCAELASGNILSIGGLITGVPTKQCWEYNGSTWTRVGDLRGARRSFAPAFSSSLCPTLDDGTVLVAGNGSNSCEIYDPVAKTWAVGNAMSFAVDGYCQLIKLQNGDVFMPDSTTGGVGNGEGMLFSYATKTWATKAGTGWTSESDYSAVLLNDGSVFFAIYDSTRYRHYIWKTNNTINFYGSGFTDYSQCACLGSDGNVYLLSGSNNTFRKFNSTTHITSALTVPSTSTWANGCQLKSLQGGAYLVAFSPVNSAVVSVNVFDVANQVWLGNKASIDSAFSLQPGQTAYARFGGKWVMWGSGGALTKTYIFDGI